MPNTGNKQATIAYKVTVPGGLPADLNGIPVAVSGNKQAIALLTGRANPNPMLYDVEAFFNEGAVLAGGNSTQVYDPVSCPVSFLNVTPVYIVLTPAASTATLTVQSSNPWVIINGPPIATISPSIGGPGAFALAITRTVTNGQGFFYVRDTVTLNTIGVYIVNAPSATAWVLDGGTWNMLGFWFDAGVWNM